MDGNELRLDHLIGSRCEVAWLPSRQSISTIKPISAYVAKFAIRTHASGTPKWREKPARTIGQLKRARLHAIGSVESGTAKLTIAQHAAIRNPTSPQIAIRCFMPYLLALQALYYAGSKSSQPNLPDY